MVEGKNRLTGAVRTDLLRYQVAANYVPRVMCLGGVVASVQQTRRRIALLGTEFNQAKQSTELETEKSRWDVKLGDLFFGGGRGVVR